VCVCVCVSRPNISVGHCDAESEVWGSGDNQRRRYTARRALKSVGYPLLQVGINCVVSQVNKEPLRACNAADFEEEEGSGTFYPRLGSENTPPHPSTEFHFKDVCPMVFRNLREKAGISVGEYVQWLCGDAALREMSSPGKSGASFFISNNDKLLVRSLQFMHLPWLAIISHCRLRKQSDAPPWLRKELRSQTPIGLNGFVMSLSPRAPSRSTERSELSPPVPMMTALEGATGGRWRLRRQADGVTHRFTAIRRSRRSPRRSSPR
jgi:hypothetical protein